MAKRLGGSGQRRRITASLVLGDACPVERFRRGIAGREPIDDLAIAMFGVSVVPTLKCGFRETQCNLREEIIDRQKSLDTVPFLTFGIKDENCRRPLRVVASAEALVFVLLIADVNANRFQLVGDETRHLWIGIHLGFQPSAAGSHRCGGEVEQNPALGVASARERGIEIMRPGDRR